MKRILLILIICTGVANAQQATTDQISQTEVKAAIQKNIEDSLKDDSDTDATATCYAETSKVAFFEALLSENDFDIELNNTSDDLVLRNIEPIIEKLRNKKLYAIVE